MDLDLTLRCTNAPLGDAKEQDLDSTVFYTVLEKGDNTTAPKEKKNGIAHNRNHSSNRSAIASPYNLENSSDPWHSISHTSALGFGSWISRFGKYALSEVPPQQLISADGDSSTCPRAPANSFQALWSALPNRFCGGCG